MRKKVNLFCVECGRFIGEFYGHVNESELIDNHKYILCPTPLSAREFEGCCASSSPEVLEQESVFMSKMAS